MKDEIINQEEIEIIRMRIRVKTVLGKYKKLKEIANEDIDYITTRRSMSPTGGGIGNPRKLEDAVINKSDAQLFCDSVEDVLSKLSTRYRIILEYNYVHNISDIEISEYEEVDIPYPTSYYRHKNKAIRRFYSFLLTKNIK